MVTIVGLGGICLDRLAIIPALPDWDETTYIDEYSMQPGGMVATAMMAAACLGEPAEIIGGIGDDGSGHYALQELQAAGLKTVRIRIFSGETTAFSFVLVHSVSGKRTILHHRGVQAKADLGLPLLALSGVRFLHVDGSWFQTALQTAKQAKAQRIIVTLDPSSRLLKEPQTEEFFQFVDYIIPGYTFAKCLTGETDPFLAAGRMLKYGSQAVIVTKGEDGCFVSTRTKQYHVPAFHVETVDTTGAGDVFHGAFVAGLSKGYELQRAIRFASAVAALKCTKLGGQAGIPTFEETLAFLNTRTMNA